jgi:hypothetical protein
MEKLITEEVTYGTVAKVAFPSFASPSSCRSVGPSISVNRGYWRRGMPEGGEGLRGVPDEEGGE